ncbi:MAG: 16S rRNA (uracil(1498)-N(3))-methyltransferase [Proteobacteria bacterium]|nr:16S rRNA (uracil(1498)-N(3))-methyltransferase [Pseudomonadota bacterium]
MLRLFVDGAGAPLAAGLTLELPPGPARHVQVRRLQPGDELRLFDGRGGEWQAEVLAMGRQQVRLRIGAHEAIERELPQAVTLAVGMPANERMDWLVEKATELGAAAIQPLLCERSVLRLEGERAERKREHWQAQAVAAAEQSGRTRVPNIARPLRLPEWLPMLTTESVRRWLLSPAGAQPLPAAATPAAPTLLLSGPEGGLSPAEEAAALAAGFQPVQLGPRVLRAETAPLAALAVLAWQSAGPGNSA